MRLNVLRKLVEEALNEHGGPENAVNALAVKIDELAAKRGITLAEKRKLKEMQDVAFALCARMVKKI